VKEHEDRALDNSWLFYHETKEKYERLRKIKQTVDPANVFTPNMFCVNATSLKKKPATTGILFQPAFHDEVHAPALHRALEARFGVRSKL